jgi:hypothetical protein
VDALSQWGRERPPTPTQPSQLSRPPEALRQDFTAVECDRAADPAWHFKVMVHRASKVAPGGPEAPTRTEPLATLALFQRPEVGADLEVYGYLLAREVDPLDWLEIWLEDQGMTLVSRRALPSPTGVAGDVVTIWDSAETEGGEAAAFAGRFFALKFGPRMFVLALRVPRESYEAVAEDFYVAMASFTALDTETGGLLAEAVTEVGDRKPAPWHVMLPLSWTAVPDAMDDRMTSFQCTQMPLGESPSELLFGKLAFGLAERSLAKSPKAAAATFLDAIKDNRVTIAGEEFVEEPAKAPFTKSWLLVSPAVLDKGGYRDIPCEVRLRVMASEDCYFLAGVFGPSRAVGAMAWAQNKRVVDVVTETLALSRPRPS